MKEGFHSFWKDLCEYYKLKELPTARTRNTYEGLCDDIPPDKISELYTQILKNCKYFPNVIEFDGICDGFRKKARVQGKVENTASCGYCLNSGLIKYSVDLTKTVGYIDYRYACCPRCELGKSFKNEHIKFFNEIFGNEELDRLATANLRGLGRGKQANMKEFAKNASKIGKPMPEERKIDINDRRNKVLDRLQA